MEEKQFQIEELLNRDKSLSEEGFSFAMVKKLPKGKKGIETYRFFDTSFYLEIVLDKDNGVNCISFYDLLQLKNHHFRWRSSSCLQIQDIDEKEKIIHGFFPNFGEDEEVLHFEMEIEKKNPLSYCFAAKGEKKKQFLYRQIDCSCSLNGYLKFGEKLISLKQTKVIYQLDLGNADSFQSFIFDFVKEKPLFCYFANGKFSPNAVFLNGKPYKLPQAELKRLNETDPNLPWQLFSMDGITNLTFHPTCSFCKETHFLQKKIHQIYFGRFDGYLKLDDERLYIGQLFGFIQGDSK